MIVFIDTDSEKLQNQIQACTDLGLQILANSDLDFPCKVIGTEVWPLKKDGSIWEEAQPATKWQDVQEDAIGTLYIKHFEDPSWNYSQEYIDMLQSTVDPTLTVDYDFTPTPQDELL